MTYEAARIRRLLWILSLVLAVATVGCEQARTLFHEVFPRSEPQAQKQTEPVPRTKEHLRHNLLEELALCEVRHRGLFIDLSSAQADAHRPFTPGPFQDVRRVRLAGVNFSEMLLPRVKYDFFLDRAASEVAVTVKGEQGSASHITAYVDGKLLGTSRLGKGRASVIEFGTASGELAAGRHTLELRLSGRGAGSGEVKAALQWVRIHFASERDPRYPAPAWDSLLLDAALGDAPRRAIALRAPGSVRCGLVPVAGTRLKVDVGYWGEGNGTAAVQARLASGDVITLSEQAVEGGEDARWTALDLSLDAFAEQLIALEFTATAGGAGGRVLFGEPRLERHTARQTTAPARVAVLVVLGGLDRRLIPPWGSREGMPTLFELAQAGVVFEGYRASASHVNGVMASLLSGTRPTEHGVSFPAARLGSDIPLLSEAVRKQDGRAALFTNVPYSFRAFGFDRGWDRFEEYSPVEDRPGSEPLLYGRDWLKQELSNGSTAPRLLVMHLTGGHPPWDVTPEEARRLAPEDYDGIIEPRRAAIALREVRQRNRAGSRMLGPNDWVRVEALQVAALQKIDRALALLIGEIKRQDVWDTTLFAVVGDVGMGDRGGVPFTPTGRLEEARLSVPLIVKFPGERAGQAAVRHLVNTESLAISIASALRVRGELQGDAHALERQLEPTTVLKRRARVARQGDEYVLYLNRYRLTGRLGAVPTLCDLEVDPTCRFDLTDELPFVVQWMWRVGLPALAEPTLDGRPSETLVVDPDERTSNALNVYGL